MTRKVSATMVLCLTSLIILGCQPQGTKKTEVSLSSKTADGHVVLEANDQNFENVVLNSDKPIVVDFWAAWCGPCRMIAPSLEELASEHADQFKVAKVNVDENRATATKYGIRSLPTLMVFKDGKPIGQIVGAYPKETLKNKILASL